MKVLDLQCRQGHSFEGWFGSQGDYDAQRARGLVTCPMCNDSEITKMLSAPRLNLGHSSAPTSAQAETAPSEPSAATTTAASSVPSAEANPVVQMQAALMHMVRHVMANTENVGTRFAEEARKIHYGERQERNIRGHATREETEALLDEGIEVMPLPVPEGLDGPLQ